MNLFKRTIEKYGADMQIEVLIEECAELIKALQKMKRKKAGMPNANIDEGDIISEAVDVEIMIEQLKFIFLDKERWERIRRFKMNRMEARL